MGIELNGKGPSRKDEELRERIRGLEPLFNRVAAEQILLSLLVNTDGASKLYDSSDNVLQDAGYEMESGIFIRVQSDLNQKTLELTIGKRDASGPITTLSGISYIPILSFGVTSTENVYAAAYDGGQGGQFAKRTMQLNREYAEVIRRIAKQLSLAPSKTLAIV